MIFWRVRFWLFIVLLPLLGQWGGEGWKLLVAGLEQQPPLEEVLQDKVRHVTGYGLERERELLFPLELNGDQARLLTNGMIPPGTDPEGVMAWHYSLSYQVVDGAGDVVARGDYHHQTRLTRFHPPGETRWLSPAFFPVGGQFLADTRIFPLNLSGYKRPLLLRVRLGEKDPLLTGVLIRVSMQELAPEEKLDTLWLRLNRESRENIAAATLYPADLLTPEERRNLMRELGRPQGPRGAPGTDYHAFPFVVWDEAVENVAGGGNPPAGLSLGNGLTGVFTVPEAGGRVRLALEPLQSSAAFRAVTLRWFGRLATERRTEERIWGGGEMEVTLPRGGLLLVDSPDPLAARAFLAVGAGQEREITPEPRLSEQWSVLPDRPLRYPVHGTATPFRITARGMPPWSPSLEYSWRFLGNEGEVLASGREAWPPTPSAFDQVTGTRGGETRVSEPLIRHLVSPAGSRHLELSAPVPVWVSVANRPPALERTIRMPEDAYPEPGQEPLPVWFTLRPEAWRTMTGRSLMVAVQRRPWEEREEQGAAGGWRSHEPEGMVAGRYLLVPREEGSLSLPVTARGAGYRAVAAHETVTLELSGEPGRRLIAPSLVYRRPSGAGADALTVVVDSVTRMQAGLPGSSGEITLPEMAPGRHLLRLETAATTALLVSHAAEPSHVKRQVHRIAPGESLVFRVDKGVTPLILSGRLHAPAGTEGRSRLRAELDAPIRLPGPSLDDWTVTRRIHDLRPALGESLVLGAGGEQVDGGQLFFIPLGADLAPGPQRVTLTLEQGPARYLVLGEATREPMAERLLFLEGENR